MGAGLQKVCDAAAKAAQAAIGPIVDALKAAVGGIWSHWVENEKIEQQMILEQLRDAKWPDF